MYFEFGASKLAGKHVLDATFRAYETWSYNCNPHWVDLERTDNISEGTRWPGPKQLNQMGDRYVSAGRGNLCSPEQPNSWIEFNDNPAEKDEDLTTTVRALADGKMSRLTLMLRAKDESDPRAWKRFDNNAELKVWYMHKPGVPSSVGAVPGTGNSRAQCRPAKDPVTVTVDTPKVRARAQTKVQPREGEEKGALQVEFVMERSSTDTTSGSWSTVWTDYKPDRGSWTSDGVMQEAVTTNRADGGLYRFKARTQSHWVYGGKKGDLFSPYSKWCYLRIDSTAPKAPTIHSLLPYKECTTNDCIPRGGPGRPGKFHFSPNAADRDVESYRWRLLTSDADETKTVEAESHQAIVSLKPGLSGTQTLAVEASDLKKDKEGRVRWGPPAEFDFKVGLLDGTTGRWRFNDAGPGSDKTVANDTGEVGARHDVVLRDAGGTGWSTMGRRGAGDYALRLNDNVSDPDKRVGYASTDGVPVNTQDSYTVSAWAYLTDAAANRTVLSAPGEHGSAFTLYYSSALKKWVFNRTDQDRNGATYIRSTATADNPPLKVWTHLTGVFDTQRNGDKSDDTIQLFVNGQPQGKPVVLADEASTYEPWTADRNMMVGRAKVGGDYGDYFMGRVDEVAVWQDALEPPQIREEHRLERKGAPSNELVSHWDATISSGDRVSESPEDPDDPNSTGFPYRRGPLDLSGSGARLTGEDATSLVLDGKNGYASAAGPVVDETGSFTVSARVRLTKSEFAGKTVGYRGLVAGQATPVGKESSWALWVEKVADDTYQWKFGRTAVNSDGKIIATAVAPAEDVIGDKEWDTWVDVTGVFDAGVDFTDDEGDQRFGVARLYVGQFAQQGEDDAGLAKAQQGAGSLTVGRGSAKGTTAHYLPGDLAKLRVWVGAMSQEQVTEQIAEPST
ncbi:LamG-like jellyroll fold domain-containing protein [Streptomyces silvensis]|nr:LamG-like jellyroll fold domain-containing protein [Streptomyces silvensis]